jgi:hypothetical protein
MTRWMGWNQFLEMWEGLCLEMLIAMRNCTRRQNWVWGGIISSKYSWAFALNANCC